MTSHELARVLLDIDDMPLAVHANNHTAPAYNTMRVGILNGKHVIVGNFSKRNINAPNEVITDVVYGSDVPAE